MLGRRSFMAALGLAPVMAQAKMQQGLSMGPIGRSTAGQVGIGPTEDPMVSAAHNFLARKRDNINDRLHRMADHMPPKIASKKSWSPVFKTHVFEQELRAHEDLTRLYELDPAQLVALAIKKGWKP